MKALHLDKRMLHNLRLLPRSTSHRPSWSRAVLAMCLALQSAPAAWALPSEYTVESGDVSQEQVDNQQLLVHINSDQAILNFPQFDIGASETVNFHFSNPTATSSVLNRVTGGLASMIDGFLLSNGLVALLNPAGVHIGPTATIQTAGFIASTLALSNEDFLQRRWNFAQVGEAPGAIVNQGRILVGPGGVIALLGGAVVNDGLLQAEVGSVALAAGKRATLSFDRDGWLAVAVTEPLSAIAVGPDGRLVDAAVTQRGTIQSPGGVVLVRASSVEGLFDRLISMPAGVVEAASVVDRNGRIELVGDGGTVALGATRLSARGDDAGTSGGVVKVLGRDVVVDGATIDASGVSGGGTILIGGAMQGAGPELNAQHAIIGPSTSLRADTLQQGDGGRVIVWSDDATQFFGEISARGGAAGGNGGFSEVSGKEQLIFRGHVDLTAAAGEIGTLLLDPAKITIAGGNGDGNDAEARVDEIKKGQVLYADNPAAYTVYESEIEGSDANIILQARDGISTSGTFGGAQVLLKNGRNLSMETRNTAADGATGINLTTSLDGANLEFKTQTTGSITIRTGTGSSPLAAPITVGKLTAGGTGGITVNGTGTVTIGGAVSTADSVATAVPTGAISLTSTKAGVVINSDVKTGNAAVADTKKNEVAQTGNVTVSAGTSITGTGRVITGDATLTGSAADGADQATSGNIALTAGATGVSGGIGLSDAQAVKTGAATRGPSGSATDTIKAGAISLTSRDAITNGTPGTPLSLALGAATGGASTTQGTLSVTTTGAGGHIAITSSSPITLGAIVTPSGSAQTVDITTSGGAALILSNASDGVQGDTVRFDVGAGTLTLLDTNFNVGAGSLTLTGDEIALAGGANSLRGTGSLLVQAGTADRLVHIGGTIDDASRLDVLTAELAAIQDGFGSITIGRADAVGGMLIEAATFLDPVTLRSPLGGTLAVTSPITGLGNASITLQGVGSTIDLGGDIVTAGSAINLLDRLRLTSDILLDTTQGGAFAGAGVHVTGPIDADASSNQRLLTLRAGTGAVALDGAVGATQPLRGLTVVSASSVSLPTVSVMDDGVSITAGAITLNSSLLTTLGTNAGTITLTGAVTLAGPTLLSSHHATGTDAAIAINGTLNGAQDLNVDSGSATTLFGGTVGGVSPIGDGVGAALTLHSLGLATFNSTVATASGITAAGPVTLTQDATLGDGDTDTVLNDLVTLDGLTLTAADAVTFNGAVQLSGGPVSVATSDDALLFASTVNGPQNLSINAGTAATTFQGAVGSTQPLGTGSGPALSLSSIGPTTFNSTLATASGITAVGPVVFTQDVTLGDGDTTSTLDGDVTLDGITLIAIDGVRLGDATTDHINLTGGPVQITTINSPITIGGALNGAQALTLTAGTGAVSLATIGDVTPIASLTIAQAGDAHFLGAGNITGALTQTDGSGTTSIEAAVQAGGAISVANDAISFVGSGSLQTPGTMTLTAQTGAITSGTAASEVLVGALNATAATGIGAIGNPLTTTIDTLTASVTGIGDLAVSDSDALGVTSASTVDGSIDLSSAGTMTVSNTGVIANGAGRDVSLTATAGDLLIGLVQAADDLTLTATTGAIQETSPDVAADVLGDAATLTAATGIGSLAQPLQTTLNSIGGAVTGAGDVVIAETDAITLNSLTTANGSVTLTAGGPITIDNGSLIANGAGQDITLTAVTGNILVGHVQAADDVNLTATVGGIEEFGLDADADIVAEDAILHAATGIGTFGALETDLNTVTLFTGTGGATLHDLGSFTLNSLTISKNGSLNLTADGSLNVAPLTEIRVTGTGTLTLTAGAADVGALIVPEDPLAPKNTAGSSLKSETGAITLHDAGGMDLWRVTSTSGNLDITSAGAITLRDNIVTGGAGTIHAAAGDVLAEKWLMQSTDGAISLTSVHRMDLLHVTSTTGAISAVSGQDVIIRDNISTGGAGAILITGNDTITLNPSILIRTIGTGSIALSAGLDGTGQLLGDATSIILSNSGPITLTSVDDMTLGSTTSTSGAITITSGGNVTLGDDVSTGGAGAIAITADDALTIADTVPVRTLGTGGVTLLAGADGIGSFTMGVGGAIVETTSGLLSITSGSDATARRLNTTGGTIQVTSGKALTAADLVTTTNAGNVQMSAADALTLAGTGSIHTSGTGTITLQGGTDGTGALTMIAGSDLQTVSAAITLTSGSDMSATQVISTSGGPITLTSNKAMTLSNTISTSGNLSISAADLLTIAVPAATSFVRTTGSGVIMILAGSDGTGELLMTGGPVMSTSGAINLTSNGPMTLRGVTSTSGPITATAKSMLLNGTVSTGIAGTVNLSTLDTLTVGATGLARTTGSGALTLAAGTDGIGGSVVMNAGGQITTTGTAPISLTDVGGMDLQIVSSAGALAASSTGTITLRQRISTTSGALTVLPGTDGTGILVMDALNGQIQSTMGLIIVTTPEEITTGRITSTGGSIAITSAKGLTIGGATISTGLEPISGADGSIAITANDTLTVLASALVRTTGGGSVTIASGADGTGQFTMNGGQFQTGSGALTVTTPGAMTLKRLTSTSGTISATAAQAISLQDNVTTGGVGGIAITAGSGLTILDPVLVRATGSGNIALNAGAVGDFTMGLAASIESGTGVTTLTSPNHMTLGRLSSTGGAIHGTAGQTMTVNKNVVVTGGTGDINFSSQKTMTLAASTIMRTTGTGAITLAGGADGLGTDLTTGNSSSIESGGNVTLSASGRLFPHRITSVGGNILMTSGEDLVLPNTVSTTGAGTITAHAGQHLKVRRLEAATPIVLTAGTTAGIGVIDRLNQQDPLADGTNIVAPSVSMTAATGIGTGVDGPLQTAVDSLSAASASGNILISELDAITLTSVHATDGSITITAGGPITAANGTVSATGVAHDVSLTTTVGDLLVGRVDTTHQVTLTAAGSISEFDPDADVDVDALIATFVAGGAIGSAATPLRVSAGTLNASASTGGVFLIETDDVLLNAISAGADVAITSLGGTLSLGTVSATGAVTLTAQGGGSILDANGDSLNVTAGANSLFAADNVIGLLADAIDVAISNADLSVSAGGEIDGVSVNIAGSITPNPVLTVLGAPPGDVIFTQQ